MIIQESLVGCSGINLPLYFWFLISLTLPNSSAPWPTFAPAPPGQRTCCSRDREGSRSPGSRCKSSCLQSRRSLTCTWNTCRPPLLCFVRSCFGGTTCLNYGAFQRIGIWRRDPGPLFGACGGWVCRRGFRLDPSSCFWGCRHRSPWCTGGGGTHRGRTRGCRPSKGSWPWGTPSWCGHTTGPSSYAGTDPDSRCRNQTSGSDTVHGPVAPPKSSKWSRPCPQRSRIYAETHRSQCNFWVPYSPLACSRPEPGS